jgi:hypothetical protein
MNNYKLTKNQELITENKKPTTFLSIFAALN